MGCKGETHMEREYKRIQTREDLKDWLTYETRFYRNQGKYRVMNWLLLGENAVLRRHQILLRKTEYHINSGHRLLAKFFKLRLVQFQIKYGMHIPPNTFGRGLRVMHVSKMHVNDKVRAGENCTIHSLAALADGGTTYKVPRIGNGVVLFMGAIVCGDISIADNVVVGANSVVNRSVYEDNVTVAGNPARIVSHKGRIDMEKKLDIEREET